MSNYEAKIPWSMNDYNKIITAMKNELGGGIMEHFASLEPWKYSYKKDKHDDGKKARSKNS